MNKREILEAWGRGDKVAWFHVGKYPPADGSVGRNMSGDLTDKPPQAHDFNRGLGGKILIDT